MRTMYELRREIESYERLAKRAANERNALAQSGGPDWKIDSLQEVMDDAVDAIDNLREILRKNQEDWHFARGECPECQQESDMKGSYCTNCQQTAAEIRANVQ